MEPVLVHPVLRGTSISQSNRLFSRLSFHIPDVDHPADESNAIEGHSPGPIGRAFKISVGWPDLHGVDPGTQQMIVCHPSVFPAPSERGGSMTRVHVRFKDGDGECLGWVRLPLDPRLPRFYLHPRCKECGHLEAECHLCNSFASHWIEAARGELYLCPAHSFLAHAWEAEGFGEWVAYAPTVDCVCDPWRCGSP